MKQNIIKWVSRILALVLALVLLLGLIGPALAAEEDSPVRYVALGDSMSNGYGLNGYYLTLHTDDGTECTDESCARDHEDYSINGFLQGDTAAYPALFAAEYGFDLTQLSMSGLRAEDVLYLLTYGTEDQSYADDYTIRAGVEGRFEDQDLAKIPAMEGQTGVEAVAKVYQQSVTEADVLTLSLGYNNFGTFLTARLCYEISQMGFDLGGTYYESDLQDMLNAFDAAEGAEAAEKVTQLLTTLEGVLGSEDSDSGAYAFCKSMIDAGVYSYAGFMVAYRDILDYIAANNPGAQVLVLNLGNAMEGMKLTIEGVELDLGRFFGILIDSANLYLKNLCGEYEDLDICYVEHDSPDLMVSRIAAGNFEGSDVLRERILQKCCAMVFPLLGMEEPDLTLDQVEALEAALNAGELAEVTAAVAELDFEVNACALYLGIEQSVIASAGETSIDSAAFSALMEEGGVDSVFGGVAAACEENKTAALAELEDQLAEAEEETRAAAALLVTPDAMAGALEDDTIHALLHLMARFLIGDGVGCHPSAEGHQTIDTALSGAYRETFLADQEILAQLQAGVDEGLADSGLTRPESEESLSMLTNYIADKNSYYVAVGGASAYGESYVPLVAESLEVPYTNLTAKNMQTGFQTMAVIWANQEEIAKADIITVGLQTSIAVESLLSTASENSRLLGITGADLLAAALKSYADGCASYATRLEDIVTRIRELNDDAAVLVVGMYDPLENITVTLDGIEVDLSGLLDELVETVNLYAASYCSTSKDATYVNAPKVETVWAAEGTPVQAENQQLLYSLLRDGTRLDPSEAGHSYIRDQILGSIIGVCRLAGDTRFDTALKVAEELKDNLGLEKFENIIIASGTGFADALSGSYLASVKDAPILLSYNTAYNQLAADYVKANLADSGTVYILGGTAAVPEEMELMLEGLNVVRLAGDDRFGTNLAILREAGVTGQELLVCTGTDFADSLSASATGLPILLVHDQLLEAQEEYLAGLENPSFTVIGGEAAVAPEIAGALEAYGETDRVAGENRIETSVAIAWKYFGAPEVVVLASAANYPDGLCGGVLAGSMDAPLLLTTAGYGKTVAAYTGEYGITDGIVLGGKNAVTNAAARAVFGLGTRVEIPTK